VFAKLEEVEKLKQAIKLLREVYRLADKPVKDYFDKIQM
jgi:preprotein translocase subunit Sss1